MFATMGVSANAEGSATLAYNKMAKQAGDPDASTLLMGWDNIPVRSEKSLYDIALWIREDEKLKEYFLNASSQDLAMRLKAPNSAPVPLFPELASRLQTHLEKFGHIVFQLDFAEPLPLDNPATMLENIKMYLRGEGSNPHERQKTAEQKRIQTTEIMLKRLKGFKLWAFRNALNFGQAMAEIREDALAEIGLAYPKMRELLRELGGRFVEAGVIQQADDIFWLEKEEVSACVARLESNQNMENLVSRVADRKVFNQRAKQTSPPPMIPVKKRILGFKNRSFHSTLG